MTQQEKRPVHCETCYSLSYSVTAPLPAAQCCGELVLTATNHTKPCCSLGLGENKVVEHSWPLLHHCRPAYHTGWYKDLRSFHDKGQPQWLAWMHSVTAHTSSLSALSVPSHLEHGHWGHSSTACRTAGMREANSVLPLLGMSKQEVSQFVIFAVFSNRMVTSFFLCCLIRAQPIGFTCKGTMSSWRNEYQMYIPACWAVWRICWLRCALYWTEAMGLYCWVAEVGYWPDG